MLVAAVSVDATANVYLYIYIYIHSCITITDRGVHIWTEHKWPGPRNEALVQKYAPSRWLSVMSWCIGSAYRLQTPLPGILILRRCDSLPTTIHKCPPSCSCKAIFDVDISLLSTLCTLHCVHYTFNMSLSQWLQGSSESNTINKNVPGIRLQVTIVVLSYLLYRFLQSWHRYTVRSPTLLSWSDLLTMIA